MKNMKTWLICLVTLVWLAPGLAVGNPPAGEPVPGGTPVATEDGTPVATEDGTPVATEDGTPVATEDGTPVATPETPAEQERKHLYFTEKFHGGEISEQDQDPRLLFENELYVARFTLHGAVFSSFVFKKSQYREMVIPKESMKQKLREKKDQQMEMIKTWSPMFLPFQMEMEIEREAESLDQHTKYHLKRELNFRPLDQRWELESRTDEAERTLFVFRLMVDTPCVPDTLQPAGTCFPAEIRKVYTMYPKRYDFDLAVRVTSTVPERLNVKHMVFHLFSLHEGESERGFFNPVSVQKEAICLHADGVSVQSFDVIMTGPPKGCMGGCSGCSCQRTPSKQSDFPRGARWAGIDARYFLMVLLKDYAADDGGCRFTAQKIQEIPGFGLIHTQMDMHGPRHVEPGTELVIPFKGYIGPKDLNYLENVRIRRSEQDTVTQDSKLSHAVDFGILGIVGRPMIFLLKQVQKVVVNWGLAIIILTILIKLVTLYWTNKSMRSMKKMAKLKPEMEALQKQYANDKEKLNQEVMALYKKHGVNPLGGCLPMILQMPIYIAWYQALMASVELYRAPLFGWIQDLTAQDPFFVLPVLMGIMMFLQQKMTPAAGDSQQAKIMLYTMPIMFTVIMLFLPSGLTLYILTNTVLGLAHQWYMNHSEDALA